jgi:hypothetical protein
MIILLKRVYLLQCVPFYRMSITTITATFT